MPRRRPQRSPLERQMPHFLPSHHSPGSGIKNVPQDKWQLVYMVYFTLGLGYLLPWNAFITAVDYFSYLYPDASVDRIFAVVYMFIGLIDIFLIILYSHKSDAYVRINVGLALFVISLLIIPLVNAFYVQGRVGLYGGFYITAGAVGLSGVADALVQDSIVGSAGELPERYMQAVYSQDASGLQKSANLYFALSIVVMFICMVFYNMVHKFPVMKYYNGLKVEAVTANEDNGPITGTVWRSTLWNIVGSIK